MKQPVEFPGSPYSASFFPGEDASVAYSDATVVIEPPVDIGDEGNIALECIFNDDATFKIKVNHLVTTISKTVIELEISEPDEEQRSEITTHDERIEAATIATDQYVDFINRVENGTFDGYIFNVEDKGRE